MLMSHMASTIPETSKSKLCRVRGPAGKFWAGADVVLGWSCFFLGKLSFYVKSFHRTVWGTHTHTKEGDSFNWNKLIVELTTLQNTFRTAPKLVLGEIIGYDNLYRHQELIISIIISQ